MSDTLIPVRVLNVEQIIHNAKFDPDGNLEQGNYRVEIKFGFRKQEGVSNSELEKELSELTKKLCTEVYGIERVTVPEAISLEQRPIEPRDDGDTIHWSGDVGQTFVRNFLSN